MSAQRNCSLAESIASLPVERRREILSGFSDAQLNSLLYDWRGMWARPNQVAPPGNWVYWLLMAGRGFGKTRTGAETVREWASKPLPGPIHLIAPTAGDIRKVMVEGKLGGLLSCYPPGEEPIYEPSKGHKLTWANGNVGYCFSADEPERLRGPQCLVGETLVRMADGSEKPIARVRVGEFVATRFGSRMVTDAWMTSRCAQVYRLTDLDGRAIVATAEHPVFAESVGFTRVSEVKRGQRICVMRAWSGAVGFGTRRQEATIAPGCCSTVKSGRRPMGRYRKATKYTTSTETRTTTESRTSSYSPPANTTVCTVEKNWTRIRKRPRLGLEKRCGESGQSCSSESLSAPSAEVNIAARPKSLPATARVAASRSCVPQSVRWSLAGASFAVSPTLQTGESSGIAAGNVIRGRARNGSLISRCGLSSAPTADLSSAATDQMPDSAGGGAPLLSMRPIASVERLAIGREVYDITVEGAHEFFANGILVHNCAAFWADELAAWRYADEAWDNLMFGFRIGDDIRGVITTTPRPIRLLKQIVADPGTVITRGSTYDNRIYLSQKFFDSIIHKYEGTRLGRQELMAELLEDTPGALWQQKRIDELRIRLQDVRFDLLTRVVVAIDPAVTNTEDSDETGIVVAALTRSMHVIVLDDLTCKDSPHGWAQKAITAFRKHKADRIVGEVNNGGDLVEGNIRAVDPNVPFRAVHASRGKAKRAEPISSLYEKGRVHHVGFFPELEKQMCECVPGIDSGHDDRLDALVWAVTELLVDTEEQRATIYLNDPGSYTISPV